MSSLLPAGLDRVLVTGGAGFIGGALIRRLLAETTAMVFNLDKCGYASDLSGIERLGTEALQRHELLKVDLVDGAATEVAVRAADPDLVLHLAAESHVDRSIDGPGTFIESNVTGTYNLLQAVRAHWEALPSERRERFRLHHISTDEVFGSLGPTGRFAETTPYDPRSPYSASKAASDHLVSAWHHTYGLPVVLTNCSNNYGPWQFPEKLIPVVIRFPSTAMGPTCAIGSTSRTTWTPCCWRPAGGSWGAATAWAATASAVTNRWSRRSAPCWTNDAQAEPPMPG